MNGIWKIKSVSETPIPPLNFVNTSIAVKIDHIFQQNEAVCIKRLIQFQKTSMKFRQKKFKEEKMYFLSALLKAFWTQVRNTSIQIKNAYNKLIALWPEKICTKALCHKVKKIKNVKD